MEFEFVKNCYCFGYSVEESFFFFFFLSFLNVAVRRSSLVN